MTNSSKWWSGLALVVASVVIAVGIGELALRMVITRLPVALLIYLNPALKDSSPETWERIREYLPNLNVRVEDPDTGWNFKPNMRSTGTNEEGEPYDVTTSPEGFFTPSVPARTTTQLVLLGDSFLSTFYVRRPIPWVMAEKVGVPVYNLAVAGWGPESYREGYRKFVSGRHHDLVVVFTFMNDITDVLNWSTWKSDGFRESFLTWIQRTTAQDDSVNRGTRWPDRHLVVWNLAKFALTLPKAGTKYVRQPIGAPILAADETKQETFSGVSGSFELQFGRGLIFTDNDPAYFLPGGGYYSYMQAYFESLLRLKSAIEGAGARMILVWVPTKERVYLPLLPPERRGVYVTNHSGDIGGLEVVVSRFAQAEGLSFLDLTDPLMDRARQGEKLYFTVDGHFNSYGNEVVGNIVADFVKQLPEHPPQRVTGLQLFLKHGQVVIERPLTIGDATYRATILQATAAGWLARGEAESRYAYLAQWPEALVPSPQLLIAKGIVHSGGFTMGLLKDNKWALQFNVTRTGAFDVALPVTEPGPYVATIANCLPEGSLQNNFEVTSLGWATPQ